MVNATWLSIYREYIRELSRTRADGIRGVGTKQFTILFYTRGIIIGVT